MSLYFADMYGKTGEKDQHPSSSEMVSQEAPIQAGASFSWFTLVILFVVFRVVYEMGK